MKTNNLGGNIDRRKRARTNTRLTESRLINKHIDTRSNASGSLKVPPQNTFISQLTLMEGTEGCWELSSEQIALLRPSESSAACKTQHEATILVHDMVFSTPKQLSWTVLGNLSPSTFL